MVGLAVFKVFADISLLGSIQISCDVDCQEASKHDQMTL